MSIFLSLGVVEVVLRFYNPLGFRIKGDKIILPVNKKEFIQKPGELVVNQKNSLGFRGPEPPEDFAQRLTIVAVGGSTTECFDLDNDKTWPLALGRKLEKDFPQLWMNNAGLCGHSTFGHIILIQDYLYKLKPKVALYLVGINEVGIEEIRHKDSLLKVFNFRSLERTLASMANYSEVVAACLNIYRFYFPKTTLQLVNPQVAIKKRILHLSEETKAATLKEHREKYLEPYRQRLKELLQASREKQTDPVLITQPGCFGDVAEESTGVYLGNIQPFKEKHVDGDLAWKILELYNGVTRKVGEEEGVLVIDLAREMPKRLEYYDDLVHYTNAGAEKVADILYRHLKPYLAQHYNQYLRASPRPG